MKQNFCILLMTFLICTNSYLLEQIFLENSFSSPNSSYSYYVYVSEWAGSICKNNDCLGRYIKQIDTRFWNIHGLWPTTAGGDSPNKQCLPITFKIDFLHPLTLQLLETKWSGLFANSTYFHAHEWNKHGRCWNHDPILKNLAIDIDNPIDEFFRAVITLANSVDLYHILDTNGIVPSENKTYTREDFTKALKNGLNITKAKIVCSFSKKKQYIEAMYLCLDLDYKFIDCPESADKSIILGEFVNECHNNDIIYPPL